MLSTIRYRLQSTLFLLCIKRASTASEMSLHFDAAGSFELSMKDLGTACSGPVYFSLGVLPPDTPVPLVLLMRLFRMETLEAAQMVGVVFSTFSTPDVLRYLYSTVT